jgi:hypothetical protein
MILRHRKLQFLCDVYIPTKRTLQIMCGYRDTCILPHSELLRFAGPHSVLEWGVSFILLSGYYQGDEINEHFSMRHVSYTGKKLYVWEILVGISKDMGYVEGKGLG